MSNIRTPISLWVLNELGGLWRVTILYTVLSITLLSVLFAMAPKSIGYAQHWVTVYFYPKYEAPKKGSHIASDVLRGGQAQYQLNGKYHTKFSIYLSIKGFAMVGVFVFMLYQVRKILQSLKERRPFTIKNANRLMYIGFIVIIGELVMAILGYAESVYMQNNIVIEDLELISHIPLHFSTLFLGLMIVVISEFFRMATEMQEEQDLTV